MTFRTHASYLIDEYEKLQKQHEALLKVCQPVLDAFKGNSSGLPLAIWDLSEAVADLSRNVCEDTTSSKEAMNQAVTAGGYHARATPRSTGQLLCFGDAGSNPDSPLITGRTSNVEKKVESNPKPDLRAEANQLVEDKTEPTFGSQHASSEAVAEEKTEEKLVSIPIPQESHQTPTESEDVTPKSTDLKVIARAQDKAYAADDMSWRARAYHILHNPRCEMAISGLILANAVVMTFDVQYDGLQVCFDLTYRGCTTSAEETWPGAAPTFESLHWIFGILFLVEAVLKIVVFGRRYLFDHWTKSMWNWLDVSCVLAFLVDKLDPGTLDAKALRLLRLLRLVRLVRLIRSLESFDMLYIMATAIRGISRILVWAIVLLALMLATCALFLSMFLHSSYFNNLAGATIAPAQLETYRKLYEYFGTFTRCLLSMFEITLGNWPPIARLLSEEVSEVFWLICVLHKLSIGFAVVGVINGVIMQETFKVAATDDVIMVRQKKRAGKITKDKMVQLFEALDDKGTGLLQYEDFAVIAQDPDVKIWLASMDIETDDLKTLFNLIDMDGNGELTIMEIVQRVPRIKGAARSIDCLAMRRKLNDMIEIMKTEDVKIDGLLAGKSKKISDLTTDQAGLGGNYSPTSEVHTMEGIRKIGECAP